MESIPRNTNRIYLAGAVVAFVVIGFLWRLTLRPVAEQIQRARRNGVTEQGGEPAPVQQSGNIRIAMHHDLLKAAEQGQWEPIAHQLATGMSPDEHIDGRTLMMIAAQCGQLDVMRRLYSHGSKIDTRDGHGNTALMYAARYGQTEVARFLLEHGANPQNRNGYRLTAVDMTVAGQCMATYALLKEHGATVNLLQAAQMDDRTLTDALLAHGMNVNAVYPSLSPSVDQSRSDEGLVFVAPNVAGPGVTDGHDYRVPLAGAAESGHLDVAELLITHGAAVNQQDRQQMTALMYAAQHRNPEAVRFLLSHGAKVDSRTLEVAQLPGMGLTQKPNREIVTLLQQAQAQRR